MIIIKPGHFWALTESLLADGYLPTENIIVLRESNGLLTVKEGNRRIGALKLCLGLMSVDGLPVPPSVIEKINYLGKEWKSVNSIVPCSIYEEDASALVDKIVKLTHGKSAKAGRDGWTAVAKARHNRDKNQASEPALDLLEKFLDVGTVRSAEQAELWSGDFPLSVLSEALSKSSKRFGATSAKDLAESYPRIDYVFAMDKLIHAIGLHQIKFKDLRGEKDPLLMYGVPAIKDPQDTARSGGNESPGGKSSGRQGSPGSGSSHTDSNESGGQQITNQVKVQLPLKQVQLHSAIQLV